MVEDLRRDIRFAFRSWRRRPLLASVVVLTLGLGFSTISAIFSVVQAVLLAPLPYNRPEQLIVIRGGLPKQQQAIAQLSGPEVHSLQERARTLQNAGGIWSRPAVLGGGVSSVEIEVGWSTRGLLDTFGVAPLFGRLPATDEYRRTDIVVLSASLWRQRFGGDASIVGRRIDIDHEPRTVLGIMPEGFEMLFPRQDGVPASVQAWLPWGTDLHGMPRGLRIFSVVGRLRPTATLASVSDELTSIAAAIATESTEYGRSGFMLTPDSLPDALVAPVRPTLLLLFGVVVLIWVIASANVANLLLTRALDRSTEFAVRLALGAGRWRLSRQVLAESGVIGAAGAIVGLLFAQQGIAMFRHLEAADIPRVQEVAVDGRTIAVTAIVAITTAMAFGWLALRHAVSAMSVHLQAVRGTSARTTLAQRVLVIAQVALSVILLSGAGLLVRSVLQLNAVRLGFSPDHVVSVRVSLPDVQYPYATSGEKIAEFYRRLDEALLAIPGVRTAGATLSPPLADAPIRPRPYAYRVDGGEIEWGTLTANYRAVTPGWFAASGVRLVAGRMLHEGDRWDRPLSVVIDTSLATKAWPGKEAIGQPIRVEIFRNGAFGPQWGEVVGVVEPVRLNSLIRPEREQLYVAHHQAPQRTMFPTILTTGDPLSVVPQVQSALQTLQPDLPIFDVRLADTYVSNAMAQTRLATIALGIFAALAASLAAAGVYASIAASVTQRRREIGVRLALGCSPGRVFRGTMEQGLRLTAMGIGVGLLMAAGLNRFLASLLFGVSSTDPVTMIMVALAVTGIAAMACLLPALKAAYIDPRDSLTP